MSTLSVEKIKEWLGFRTMDRDLFIKVFDIPEEAIINTEFSIYQLKDLTMIHHPEVIEAQMCFHPSGSFAFIRVYQAPLEQFSIKDITAYYGEPESVERSSAGKRAHYNVYAKEGFAFSTLEGEIHFMDLFPSTSTEDYINNTYKAPGPFIR